MDAYAHFEGLVNAMPLHSYASLIQPCQTWRAFHGLNAHRCQMLKRRVDRVVESFAAGNVPQVAERLKLVFGS